MAIETVVTPPPVNQSEVVSSKIGEMCSRLKGLTAVVDACDPMPPMGAMTYAEAKAQLLVNYAANLSVYVALKATGECTPRHPVLVHLAWLRSLIERMQSLDSSLRFQMDRLAAPPAPTAAAPSEEADGGATPKASAAPVSAKQLPALSTKAVKAVSASSIRKRAMDLGDLAGGRMAGSECLEIDPSLIAQGMARITGKKTRKAAAKVEGAATTKKKTRRLKKKAEDSDEEIPSDFE